MNINIYLKCLRKTPSLAQGLLHFPMIKLTLLSTSNVTFIKVLVSNDESTSFFPPCCHSWQNASTNDNNTPPNAVLSHVQMQSQIHKKALRTAQHSTTQYTAPLTTPGSQAGAVCVTRRHG